MKTQHTPGPWIFEPEWSTIRTHDLTGTIAFLLPTGSDEPEHDEVDWEQLRANAKLIAAAPELLKFIQKVAHWELVDCDQHEYVMEDEEVRAEAHRILNAYNERLKLTDQ